MRRLGLFLIAGAFPLLAGCATAGGSEKPLRNVSIPVRDPTPHTGGEDDDAREDPPDAETSKPVALPAITRDRLPNGVGIETARVPGSPYVELRATLSGAGSSADGDRTGLASLTSKLAWEGGAAHSSPRETTEKLAALGATATWSVRRDAIEIALSAPKDHLADALTLIANALREPRFDPQEFAKVKRRERARRAEAMHSHPLAIGQALVAREIFKLPTSLHPYSSPEATAAELDKLTLADVKGFWKETYTPMSFDVIVAGDLDHTTARAAIDRALSSWKGNQSPGISFTDPQPIETPRVVVADLPDAGAADVFAAVLSPNRDPEEWASLAVTTELLGGGESSRFAIALRDATPLAGRASAEIIPVARGPLPFVAHACGDASKAGLMASDLVDEIHKLADGPPPDTDVASARRRVSDSITRTVSTARGVADLLLLASALGLPDDFIEKLPQHLHAVDATDVQKSAKTLIHGLTLIVVGDASKAAPLLQRFGDVTVLLPDRNFERARTLLADPEAPLVAPPPKTPAP